jgi:hypothetical protein
MTFGVSVASRSGSTVPFTELLDTCMALKWIRNAFEIETQTSATRSDSMLLQHLSPFHGGTVGKSSKIVLLPPD